ncbi:MAG: YjfB family protein [Deltaproteobacteria bacterium]|nr:YjfB family protein [Deltaproteobacteria bacterium]
MSVSSIGYGSIAMSMASQASALKTIQTQSEASVAILDEAMEFQKEMATTLLECMGVGQNVDIVV